MSAGKYTLFMDQGAYLTRTMTYLDPDQEPIDLTGFTARMQIRGYPQSEVVWLTLTSESGEGITIGGADGTVVIEITSAQTADITTDGFYDIELIAPSGEVDRFLQGAVILSNEVTR